MKRILLIICFTAWYAVFYGQDLAKRYSFAKAYFGIDALFTSNLKQSAFLNNQNIIEKFDRNSFFTPTINIGATHFWGYADFYVSITTSPIKTQSDIITNSTRFGAMTGLRLYPLKLSDQKIRPFIGYKFSPIRYKQESITDENYITTNTKSIIDVGIGYTTSRLYCYLGYNRILNPDIDIYLSRTTAAPSSYPHQFFTLGINWAIETTDGSYSKPVQTLDSLLSNKNKFGLFFGIGPSAAFPTASSEYINDIYPFLDDKSMPAIFPDISLGYHFTKQDFVIATAFRRIKQNRSAFSFNQEIKRNSFVVEAYKFLFDYHGFAPFLGVGLSQDRIYLNEADNGNELTKIAFNKTVPSIIFGWDIRPSKKADPWLLRTNLRYLPTLEIEHNDKKLSLQYLEFNFIQVVIYPQRIKELKKMR